MEFKDYFASVIDEDHLPANAMLWIEHENKNVERAVIQDYLDTSTGRFTQNYSDVNIYCLNEFVLPSPFDVHNQSFSPEYTQFTFVNESSLDYPYGNGTGVWNANTSTYYNTSTITNYTTNLTKEAILNRFRNLTILPRALEHFGWALPNTNSKAEANHKL